MKNKSTTIMLFTLVILVIGGGLAGFLVHDMIKTTQTPTPTSCHIEIIKDDVPEIVLFSSLGWIIRYPNGEVVYREYNPESDKRDEIKLFGPHRFYFKYEEAKE